MFLRDTNMISDRIALSDEAGVQFSYGELEERSIKCRQHIPARSLVIIMCDYSIETIAFYYCQMINHAVPILLDKDLDGELLSKIIENYEPQFIWYSEKVKDKFRFLSSQAIFEDKKHILVRTSFESAEMHPELALLLTTSGSTGSLKMVRLTYENLRYNCMKFAKALHMSPDDRGITTVPIHHCYGMTMMHVHWIMGACVYVTQYSILNIKFWDFFEKMKITNFFGVSYTYDMLKQIDFLNRHYKSLRFMAQAGTKLSEDQQKRFGGELRKKNIEFYICYGQTEATGCISMLSPEKVLEKLGSVGKPISGVNLSIEGLNDEGEGEFVCRGKSIAMGYASDKYDLIRGDENCGCLYTGDIGRVDNEGDYFIKGRKNRFVKILGRRVSLDELETVLSTHLQIEKVACTGYDNKIKIYCLENCTEEILKFCSKRLSIPRNLIECFYLETFPYTSSGKIRYISL